MLKSDMGTVEINGYKHAILAELEMLVTCMLRKRVISKEELDNIVEKAYKESEKPERSLLDAIKEVNEGKSTEDIVDFLKGVLSACEGKKNETT